jgi:hypothetical protein
VPDIISGCVHLAASGGSTGSSRPAARRVHLRTTMGRASSKRPTIECKLRPDTGILYCDCGLCSMVAIGGLQCGFEFGLGRVPQDGSQGTVHPCLCPQPRGHKHDPERDPDPHNATTSQLSHAGAAVPCFCLLATASLVRGCKTSSYCRPP